jgi:hypothetical protein
MIDKDFLIDQSVKYLPIYRDTHSIKGVLSVIRFQNRYPHWDERIFQDALNLPECLNGPSAKVLFSNQINNQSPTYPERNMQRVIETGLFPLAYQAGMDWYTKSGIENILMTFKKDAINSIHDLGHAWTIWCSFYELLPHLKSTETKLYAVERLIEFISQQLYKYKGNEPQSPKEYYSDRETPKQDLNNILDLCLKKPGFLGHNLLTLTYLIRHKSILTDTEYNAGLFQIEQMANYKWDIPRYELKLPVNEIPDFEINDTTLESTILSLLANGMRNVHTLTIADITYDIWDVCDIRQRQILKYYLDNIFDKA